MTAPSFPQSEIDKLRARAEQAADRIGAGQYWTSMQRSALVAEAKRRGINARKAGEYLPGLLARQDDDAIRMTALYDKMTAIFERAATVARVREMAGREVS